MAEINTARGNPYARQNSTESFTKEFISPLTKELIPVRQREPFLAENKSSKTNPAIFTALIHGFSNFVTAFSHFFRFFCCCYCAQGEEDSTQDSNEFFPCKPPERRDSIARRLSDITDTTDPLSAEETQLENEMDDTASMYSIDDTASMYSIEDSEEILHQGRIEPLQGRIEPLDFIFSEAARQELEAYAMLVADSPTEEDPEEEIERNHLSLKEVVDFFETNLFLDLKKAHATAGKVAGHSEGLRDRQALEEKLALQEQDTDDTPIETIMENWETDLELMMPCFAEERDEGTFFRRATCDLPEHLNEGSEAEADLQQLKFDIFQCQLAANKIESYMVSYIEESAWTLGLIQESIERAGIEEGTEFAFSEEDQETITFC